MIADFSMTASPVPRILRALRLVISEKSGSFDGHIEAICESATRKALWLAIARLRRGSRGRRQLSGERALHIIGVALVEDRGRDRPQADFTVLIPTNRIGLRPELVSTH